MRITSDISKVKSQFIRDSFTALKRAALEARKIAIQTDTAIIIMQEGKITRVTADTLKRTMNDDINLLLNKDI
ncbi:hypothetical protein AwWohl_07270 [Gammaproteobacteria bacterium]|nr:hypothetical protein AwWohl_07270 [Gammaproteobacteria bacterium]